MTTLRFVAASYVVLFHFAPYYYGSAKPPAFVSLGYTGVTFFFMLSGFILAHAYRDTDFASAQARRLFYRARFARIFPVYLPALALHLPWFLTVAVDQPQPLAALIASGTVLAPLGIHAWVPGAACSLDCPSWSVSVELFFYALFPLALPAILRHPARMAQATLALWVAGLILTILLWQAYGGGVSLIQPESGGVEPVLVAEFVKYFPLLHLPEFLAGLLLFAASRRFSMSRRALVSLALMSATLIVACDGVLPEPAVHNGLTMLAWGPLILACAGLRRGMLCSRPLVFLGRVSFAFYLLHVPVLTLFAGLDRGFGYGWLGVHPWASATLSGLASLSVAALLHRWVEEPARRWILRQPPRPLCDPPPIRLGARLPFPGTGRFGRTGRLRIGDLKRLT